LKESGIRKGDRLYYTLRGNPVSARYVDADFRDGLLDTNAALHVFAVNLVWDI
jgi:hypothetical protein